MKSSTPSKAPKVEPELVELICETLSDAEACTPKHDIPIESSPAAPGSKIDVLEMTKPAGEPSIVSA